MYAVVQIGSRTRRSDCAIKRSVFLSDGAPRARTGKTEAAIAAPAAVFPKSRRVGRRIIIEPLCCCYAPAGLGQRCAASGFLDVPQEECRGFDVTLEVLAHRGFELVLPGRNVGNDLESALLDFGGDGLAILQIV